MRSRSTQFPEAFAVRKVEENLFQSPGRTLPKVAVSSSPIHPGWKSNKSYEIRIASRQSQARSEYASSLTTKESLKERYIHQKILELQRRIVSVRAQFSSEAWAQRNATRIPRPPTADSVARKRRRGQTPQTSGKRPESHMSRREEDEKRELNYSAISEPVKPIVLEPLASNPFRKQFNHEYDRGYKKIYSFYFGNK
jgi:hypothetical protein